MVVGEVEEGEVVVGEVEEGEVVEGEQTILAMLSSCVSQVVFHKFLTGRCTNAHHMRKVVYFIIFYCTLTSNSNTRWLRYAWSNLPQAITRVWCSPCKVSITHTTTLIVHVCTHTCCDAYAGEHATSYNPVTPEPSHPSSLVLTSLVSTKRDRRQRSTMITAQQK